MHRRHLLALCEAAKLVRHRVWGKRTVPLVQTTPSTSSQRPRVAYLLADAGIGLWDSRKGSSIHARSMIKAFEQEGCQVDVYVMRAGKQPRAAKAPSFKLIVVHQSRVTRWWLRRWLEGGLWRRVAKGKPNGEPPNWMTAVGWLLWHRDFLREIRKRCATRRPNLIYARSAWFAFPYAALQRMLQVPLFLEVNSVMTIEKAARGELAFGELTRKMELEQFEAAREILPVSAEIKQQIVRDFGIEPAKIIVTPNAVDLDLFRPAENGPEHAPGEFVIGAVNSMRAYHGTTTLLRAAALLKHDVPGLRLLLIGNGPQFDEMKALARELEVDAITEFTGTLDHDQVHRRLRECDVCVAPYEGELNQYNCPMKLYEYMALKIPIVASRWGDIPNIMREGETALLHAPADPQGLAEAVRAILRDPQAARDRAEAAYEVVRRHTWRVIARRIMDTAGLPAAPSSYERGDHDPARLHPTASESAR